MKKSFPPATLYTSQYAVVRRGFTIIEVITVISIISVLAGITIPAVKSLSKNNNRVQAQNQIRALLSQARSIAISQHRQAGVVFFQETKTYSKPVHGDQIAAQLFVEDYDQTTSPPKNPKNTLYVQYSTARSYLPQGIAVAALNDAANKGVVNDESSGGHNLAILFDSSGQMITRHGVARRNLPSPVTNPPGSYPYAIGDWNFASQGTTNPNSDNSSNGISFPGIFVYDPSEYAAQNIPSGLGGDAARNNWIKKNASVIIVNANTGALLP